MDRSRMMFWTAIAGVCTLALAIVLAFAFDGQEVPEGFSRSDQCEALDTGSSVMEPQNTWSNLGYLVAGLLILFRNAGTRRVLGLAFGGALIALAWFSGLYHAQPVSTFFRRMDITTIYWVLPILIAYAVHGVFVYRISGRSWALEQMIGIVVFIVAAGTAIAFVGGADSTIMTLVFVGILLALTLWTMFFQKLPDPLWDIEKVVYSTGLILLLLVSALTRLLDGPGRALCSPDAVVQAHAVWHLASAGTLFVGYNLLARAYGDGGDVLPQ